MATIKLPEGKDRSSPPKALTAILKRKAKPATMLAVQTPMSPLTAVLKRKPVKAFFGDYLEEILEGSPYQEITDSEGNEFSYPSEVIVDILMAVHKGKSFNEIVKIHKYSKAETAEIIKQFWEDGWVGNGNEDTSKYVLP